MKYICELCGWVYDEEETGVKVTVTPIANDSYSTKIQATIAGGTNPDQIPQYLADQKAAGLDDVLADVERQYNEWKAAK